MVMVNLMFFSSENHGFDVEFNVCSVCTCRNVVAQKFGGRCIWI